MKTTEDLKHVVFEEIRSSKEKFKDFTDENLNVLLFYNGSGLRLTYAGFLTLKDVFDTYIFEHNNNFKGKDILTISRTMKFPYYLSEKRMALFSGDDATMVKLCGSIENFLKTQYK